MRLHQCIHAFLSYFAFVQATTYLNHWDDDQVPFLDPDRPRKQVAIIGAGAGGASAAYHLAKFAADSKILVNITLFERNAYIGGRSTTVNAYDDPSIPVELGGSVFVKVNTILNDAVKGFNLSTRGRQSNTTVPGAALGIWNGEKFVFVQEGNYSWWDSAKILWKYGWAPIKTMRLMRSVVGKFLQMYEEPSFPFESLTQVAENLGLLAVTAATGEQFLTENKITGPFVQEIVQASTRVNYATNLRYIHGLEAMVCMAVEDAHSVYGGNWQMFDRMIKAANASVHLETAVTAIEQDDKSGVFAITTTGASVAAHFEDFDEVVIATPFQFSNISLGSFDEIEIDEIPYVQLHVTLLASPRLLSPAFFNLASDKPVPKAVLTTLSADEPPKDGPDSVGVPGFFSISLLDPVINPKTQGQEYLYKIFSSTPPDAEFLSGMLGFHTPDSDSDSDIDDKDISWIYRKLWNSYPREYPRVTFEEIQLAPGLWYTSGMDSFISTMETNALMGKNVAKLIADGWVRDGKERELLGLLEAMRTTAATEDVSTREEKQFDARIRKDEVGR